jgi:hypothetical protein
MTTTAKPIIKDKFWIVERDGNKIGTISVDDERFVFSSKDGVIYFDNKKQLEGSLGRTVFERDPGAVAEVEKVVHGYPVSTTPHNTMLNIKQGLPLFTKSPKSSSLYCAGYYIIQFNKGWVKSFCPKLITLDRYPFKGPFKDTMTMRQELSNVSK